MKIATVKDIRQELNNLSTKDLVDLCLRLSRFKKENKLPLTTTPENGYMEKVVDQFKILPHKIKIGG